MTLSSINASIIDEALKLGSHDNRAKIAAAVGVHRSTVKRRIDQMLEEAPYLYRFWAHLLGETSKLPPASDAKTREQVRMMRRFTGASSAAASVLHPLPIVESRDRQTIIGFPSFAALWSFAESGFPGPKRCPVCGRFVRARPTYCNRTCRVRAWRRRNRSK